MDERTCCTMFWSNELQSSSCTFCPDSGCIASADAVSVLQRLFSCGWLTLPQPVIDEAALHPGGCPWELQI